MAICHLRWKSVPITDRPGEEGEFIHAGCCWRMVEPLCRSGALIARTQDGTVTTVNQATLKLLQHDAAPVVLPCCKGSGSC